MISIIIPVFNEEQSLDSRLGFVSRKWPQDLPFHKVVPNKNDRLEKITLPAKPKCFRS